MTVLFIGTLGLSLPDMVIGLILVSPDGVGTVLLLCRVAHRQSVRYLIVTRTVLLKSLFRAVRQPKLGKTIEQLLPLPQK